MVGHSSAKATGQQELSLYERVLSTLPAAVYMCDSRGYVTFYNQAAVKLWGREPVIGKDLWCGSWKIYHPDGRPMALDECPMAQVLKTKMPVPKQEIVVEQPDGQRFHVLPHPSPFVIAKAHSSGRSICSWTFLPTASLDHSNKQLRP